jgi:hypothetical protein
LSDYYGWNPDDPNEEPEDFSLDDVIFGNAPDQDALDKMWDAVAAGEDSTQWRDFADYMYEMYDIDIYEEWDWADFREWYESS